LDVATAHRAEGYRAADGVPADHRRHPAMARARPLAAGLRELSDYMLDDIGLRREELGYEPAKPFGHRD
jgi:hypothetical protein